MEDGLEWIYMLRKWNIGRFIIFIVRKLTYWETKTNFKLILKMDLKLGSAFGKGIIYMEYGWQSSFCISILRMHEMQRSKT